VGVRADDEVARAHDALLGQQGMLDAHAALLEVVGDPLSCAKSRTTFVCSALLMSLLGL
jgi:hypothetical protein